MLGAFGVGKTSLVRRFVYNKFDEKYLSTIGVQISQKLLPPFENAKNKRLEQYNLILWDLAHIEKLDAIIRNYFRGSHGALIVFDLTRPYLVNDYSFMLDPFRQTNPEAPLIFVANKIDLVPPGVDLKPINELASKYDAEFATASAKTGEGVEDIFNKLGSLIAKG